MENNNKNVKTLNTEEKVKSVIISYYVKRLKS